MIIDLRDNGGGYGESMEYILNHFYEGGPQHIATTHFSEDDKLPYTQYSSPAIHGKNRTGTPLIVIINEETGSASEFFAYTLQAFGKAKILGEASTGAANRNSYFQLNDSFRLSISTAIPINPITKSNWEGTGIKPDYMVKQDQVNVAHNLLRSELQSNLSKE
jgi:C-terminal processing protease CtpA/Prc